ncbi:type II toxin-antitoxin system RelE/ParE family toxin [Rhodopseudomonas palustris]|uniref:type II toxin-antitoxin system RelE/ParE family toxin n=1 Tax=Rhodopseudomonas palustris TaxID=1076 RepID=UPI003D9AC096
MVEGCACRPEPLCGFSSGSSSRLGPAHRRRNSKACGSPQRLPGIGRPIRDRDFRELVLPVMGGTYVLRYAHGANGVVILRVFHSREQRDT